MENRSVSSASWELDRSLQSQWLHTTLSELDKKMKAMLTIIQDDDDHLAELRQMIEEFYASYRSLAEKYDQLQSESTNGLNSGHSSSSLDSGRKINHISKNKERVSIRCSIDSKSEAYDSHPGSAVEDPDAEFDVTNFDHESINKIADSMSIEPCNISSFGTTLGIRDNDITDFDLNRKTFGDFLMGTFEGGETWPELKFKLSKLMAENLQQQAELIKRNNEKRDAIKELHFQLNQVKGENRALQTYLRRSNTHPKQNKSSPKSILKDLILRKFFGRRSA